MFRLGDRVFVRGTGLRGKILEMCTVLLDNDLGLTKVPEYGLLPCINYTDQYNQIVNQYQTNDQKSLMMSYIDKVVFNNPATIVFWNDGTKTVVKCQGKETYDPEKGLAMAIAKRALGNEGNYYEVFKTWMPGENK